MKSLISKLYGQIPPIVARTLLRAVNASFNVSVAGMFREPGGKILLLRHIFRHNYPWGLPGGFIHADESPEQGLVRELREETGLRVEPSRVLAVHVIGPRHLELVIAGTLDVSAPLRLSHEIFEARYFAVDDLPGDMPPDQRACILKFAV